MAGTQRMRPQAWHRRRKPRVPTTAEVRCGRRSPLWKEGHHMQLRLIVANVHLLLIAVGVGSMSALHLLRALGPECG